MYKQYIVESLSGLGNSAIVVVVLFAIGLVVGFEDLFSVQHYVMGAVKALSHQFKGVHGIELFVRIFLQNLRATTLIIASGCILSIIPLSAAIANGAIIGAVIEHLKFSRAMSPLMGILSLVPHGIFEIPAILIALSLGVKFGTWPFRKNRKEFMKRHLFASVKCYLLVILPLLLIAGIIETVGIEVLFSLRK